MAYLEIWIKQQRNISEARFQLNGRHCYISGDNNQGKTTLLEAIYLACKQEPPTRSDIFQRIQYDQEESIIGVDVVEDENKRIYFKCHRKRCICYYC